MAISFGAKCLMLMIAMLVHKGKVRANTPLWENPGYLSKTQGTSISRYFWKTSYT